VHELEKEMLTILKKASEDEDNEVDYDALNTTKSNLIGENYFNQHTMYIKYEASENEVNPMEDKMMKKKLKISQYVSGGQRRQAQLYISDTALKNVHIVDLVQRFMRKGGSNNPARYGFHSVIRCYGWRPDKMLTSKLKPDWYKKGKLKKYPKTNHVFESVNVPNLYFAGALGHGLDYRKAAGGFVHGFRYNARVLYRSLMWKNHQIHWPFIELPLVKSITRRRIKNEIHEEDLKGLPPMTQDVDVENIANWFEHRMNNGDGTYQMFQQLCDVCIFIKSETKMENNHNHSFRCMEEIPFEYVEEKFGHLPRITLQFVYGKNHHGPKVFELGAVGATDGRYAEQSTFLHPKMMFWANGKHSKRSKFSKKSKNHVSDWNFHGVEDVVTEFSTATHRPFLLRYIRFALSRIEWGDITSKYLVDDRSPKMMMMMKKEKKMCTLY
jgi:hypothetical protein